MRINNIEFEVLRRTLEGKRIPTLQRTPDPTRFEVTDRSISGGGLLATYRRTLAAKLFDEGGSLR